MSESLEQEALLWLLWHHQGGSSRIGQPIRLMLGIGKYEHLTEDQVSAAKEFARRLTAEQQGQEPCDCCDGKGWYAIGAFDDPKQEQCANCYGTGKIAAPVAKAQDAQPREQLIKQMVDAFLSWPLPSTFAPDCGISFDGSWVDARGGLVSWPIGTNLFTAHEAQLMVKHMFAVADAAVVLPQDAQDGMVRVQRELIDDFPELNPLNYDEEDVGKLNDWGIRVWQAALRCKGEGT